MTDHRSILSTLHTDEELLQYRELFNLAPIGIVRTTVDGHIQDGNQAFAEMLGYSSFTEFQNHTGGNVTDLYEEPQIRKNLLARLTHSPQSLHFESRWRKKDRTFCDCRLHVRTSTDDAGNIRYYEGFIEDISREKEILLALEKNANQYRSVFENTGSATIIIENDTTISLANARFAKLAGYSKEELEGKMKWPTFIAKATDLEKMMQYHVTRRQTSHQVPIEYEFTLKDKHGNLKEVFLRVDMISGSNASVASLLDITSLKATRRHFLESSSRLTGVLEAFEGLLYICSADHRLLFMNRKLKDSLSPAPDENQPCYKQLYKLDTPCPWCENDNVFQGKTIKTEFLSPTDGRWYFAVSSPIYEDEQQISQKQTLLLDIHERKLTEESLKERENYLAKENLRLRETIRDRYKFGAIVGKSKAMQKVYELILRAAATNANVILYGESGTGKELVARAIHEMSDRAGKSFIPVNCGAIPAELMESEFFGYRKGAFTGAEKDKPGFFDQADHGTLFLDELGEITEAMQIKLLRVLDGNGFMPLGGLQTRHTDVRIIAATNKNLRALLDNGRMREDFFYRIHIIPITIPPLRHRLEDIPFLVDHFLNVYSVKTKRPVLRGQDLEMLAHHDWPGNVRELANTIQRYVNLRILDFPGRMPRNSSSATPLQPMPPAVPGLSLKDATKNFERDYIQMYLQDCKWNRTRVAELLGIERKTLYLKMHSLGIAKNNNE